MKLATPILSLLLCISWTASMPVSDNDGQLQVLDARASSKAASGPNKTPTPSPKAVSSKGASVSSKSGAAVSSARGKSSASGSASSVKGKASASVSGSAAAANATGSAAVNGTGSALAFPSNATVAPTGVDPLEGGRDAANATAVPAPIPSDNAKGNACQATVRGRSLDKRCYYDQFVISKNGKVVTLPSDQRIASREAAGIWIVNGRVYKVYSSTNTQNRVIADLEAAEEYGLPVGNSEVRSGTYYPSGGRAKSGFVVISRPATGVFVQASVSSTVAMFTSELRRLNDDQLYMVRRVMEGAVYARITDGQGFLDARLRSPFQFIDVHIGTSSNCQVLLDACKAEERARGLRR